jgi:hypothetical protein
MEDHRLFLHYSGHGSQAYTDSPSEPDHYDESEQFVETPRTQPYANTARRVALVPVDCPPEETDEGVAGMIRDNELREILVDRLPVGCHLTVGLVHSHPVRLTNDVYRLYLIAVTLAPSSTFVTVSRDTSVYPMHGAVLARPLIALVVSL